MGTYIPMGTNAVNGSGTNDPVTPDDRDDVAQAPAPEDVDVAAETGIPAWAAAWRLGAIAEG